MWQVDISFYILYTNRKVGLFQHQQETVSDIHNANANIFYNLKSETNQEIVETLIPLENDCFSS